MNEQSLIERMASRLLAMTEPSRLNPFKRKPPAGPIIYGGFNDRMFAAALDIGLCLILFYTPLYRLSALLFGQERAALLYSFGATGMTPEQQLAALGSSGFWATYLANSGLQILLFGVIFVALWSYSSATPGKWLLRMRIVDEATGKRPTHRQFIIRFLGTILASLPLMLGLIWIAFDKKKQGWHDKMAGTVVIKVKHWRITPPEVSEYPESTEENAPEAPVE